MRIKIIRQFDAAVRDIGQLTQKNWESYAERRGYPIETRYHSKPMVQANRMKLKAMRDAINPLDDAEYLFWSDADTAVTNPEITLGDVLLEARVPGEFLGRELIFDVSKYGLSTGNFFVRNNDRAKELLDVCVTLGNVTEEVNRRFATLKPHEAGDESTLKLLIESFPNFSRRVATVKIADFPSTHTKDSFILHAAQRPFDERIKLLSPYCQ